MKIQFTSKRLLAVGLSLAGFINTTDAAVESLSIRVKPEVLHRIDRNIYGQFMERAAFGGETGPEAAIVAGTHQLQPRAEDLIGKMEIPVLRFPGGTDVDFIDWTDMVDNLPGRSAERPVTLGYRGDPVTNGYGYDEFLQMCERHGSDAILVVNLRDALMEKKPIKEAAEHAAALVAYCAASVDQDLPGDLEKWPKLRAKNGRNEPYAVKYVQIGNETWMFNPDVEKKYGEKPWQHWQHCIETYIEAIHAVLPEAEIIVDAFPWAVSEKLHRKYGDLIAGYGVHIYHPWGMPKVLKAGKEIDRKTLTAEEIWKAWVVTPKVDAQGQSIIQDDHLNHVRKFGGEVAMTEWNWNGWWGGKNKKAIALDSQYARGVGAASLLHAMLRQGDLITLATQSMLVGKRWQITAVRVDPENELPAYQMPSGMVTELYSKLAGEQMYAVELAGVETYKQPYKMSGLGPNKAVAYVDVLATGGEDFVTVHMINRRFEEAQSVAIDLSAFKPTSNEVELVILQGRLDDAPGEGESLAPAQINTRSVEYTGDTFELELPPRSIVFATSPISSK